jgi:hypothetical protein
MLSVASPFIGGLDNLSLQLALALICSIGIASGAAKPTCAEDPKVRHVPAKAGVLREVKADARWRVSNHRTRSRGEITSERHRMEAGSFAASTRSTRLIAPPWYRDRDKPASLGDHLCPRRADRTLRPRCGHLLRQRAEVLSKGFTDWCEAKAIKIPLHPA